MAEKRMFAKTIIDSDAFLDMPITSRLLYYDLSMRADDDGFVNSPKKVMRIIGASEDDLRILALRKFIIPFESGIVVIKHWKIHNYIRKDMYHETKYKEEREMLALDENDAYSLRSCNELVTSMSTQNSIDKDSIDKDNIEKDNIEKDIEEKKEKPVRKRTAPLSSKTFSPNDELLDAKFKEFIEHRKRLKKPLDEYKAEGIINELEKLSGGDNNAAIKILQQSIDQRWQGVFPLKAEKNTTSENWVDVWRNA